MKLFNGAFNRNLRRGLTGSLVLMATGWTPAAQAAVSIPTGIVDTSVLAARSPAIGSAALMKWRTGTSNQPPVSAAGMTFQYLTTGTNLALPSRGNPKDFSANDQGDLWSDDAIQLNYTRGNALSSAILLYTNNAVTGPTDPLGQISQRGGLVGGANGGPTDPNRDSVIPLIWKAAALSDLQAASGANVNGSVPIPATSPLYMPTQITSASGGSCPAEGPYIASTRANNGYCDYATHYTIDKNNTDPNHLWYTGYPAGSANYNNAYTYASVVGPFGVNHTETGTGAGTENPTYLMLGSNFTFALSTQYATTIFLDVLTK